LRKVGKKNLKLYDVEQVICDVLEEYKNWSTLKNIKMKRLKLNT
jgi:hypothetical protein